MNLRFLALSLLYAFTLLADPGGELRFTLRSDPKTFNPLLAEDESSEAIRYLTGGVLIRLNRLTQELEPELAQSWKVSESNRRIDFELRPHVEFSDGTPFSCQDVAFTIRQLMDPALHSPSGDSFRSGPGAVEVRCSSPTSGMARFPAPVAALADQFDQVAILSERSLWKEAAVLGPFEVAEYKAGSSVLLKRNDHYWKKDANGRRLPYLDAIRLEIQQNRDAEVLRFRRGQIDLIGKLDPSLYDQLALEMPKAVIDAGPSLDWEVIFFNQVPNAPIKEYRRAWFRSVEFRRAISEAINREDIARIVYRGHARPAAGPVSPSNKVWIAASAKPDRFSSQAALERLGAGGFHLSGKTLFDGQGHAVEFSMITNAGSKLHAQTMTLIQQDLAGIGIKLNVVSLDFPSLIERISRTYQYEACLMAFANIGLDPNEQMNVWLSSAPNHQWNPSQKTPATAWEAELDKLMLAQASATDHRIRKASFDKAQEIISDQAPMLFVVHPNFLAAISPQVRNAAPALLTPQIYWNAERLYVARK